MNNKQPHELIKIDPSKYANSFLVIAVISVEIMFSSFLSRQSVSPEPDELFPIDCIAIPVRKGSQDKTLDWAEPPIVTTENAGYLGADFPARGLVIAFGEISKITHSHLRLLMFPPVGFGWIMGTVVLMLLIAAAFIILVMIFRCRKTLKNGIAERAYLCTDQPDCILNATMDGFFLIDMKGRILDVNDTFCQMSGYRAQELTTMHISDLEATETSEETALHIQKLIAAGRARFESRHRRKDGSVYDIEVSSAYQPQTDGRLVNFVRDITDRKKNEEALHRSKQQMSNALNMAKLGHWELDLASGIFTFTDNFYSIFGVTANQVGGYTMSIGDYADRFVHPEDRHYVEDETQKARMTDELNFSSYLEHRILYADGSIGIIAVKYFIGKDITGATTKTYGVIQDVTEQKKKEDALRSSLSLLDATLESTADGILVVNLAGKVVKWNQKFLDMWNIPESLIKDGDDTGLQQYVAEQLTHPDLFLKRIKELFEKPCKTSFDPIELIDGRIFERHSQPQKVDNEVVGRVSSFCDVTEKLHQYKAIQQINKRYDALAEQSRTIAWEVDADGLFTYVNHVAELVLGYSPEELVGKMHYYDLHPEEGRDMFKHSTLKTFAQQILFVNLINPAQNRNGDTVWLSTNGMPILEPDGTLRGYRGLDTDITKQKKIQDQLRKSNDKFMAIFQNMVPGCCYDQLIYKDGIATDYRILDVNPSYEKIFGIPRADVIGKLASEVYKTDNVPLMDVYPRVVETGVPESHEVYFTPAQKHLHITVIRTEKGKFSTMFLDITERKQAEEKLRNSEAKLRAVFERATMGIAIIDSDTGKFLEVNPAYCEITGFPETEMLTLDFMTITHPDDLEADLEYMDCLRRGKFNDYELDKRHLRKDGNTVHTRLRVAPLVCEQGTLTQHLAIVADITQQKRAEDELLLQRRQLRSLINQMSDVEERERRLIATALHDHIGQAMMLVKMKLDKILISESSPHQSELGEISTELENLSETVENLTFEFSSPTLFTMGIEEAIWEWYEQKIPSDSNMELTLDVDKSIQSCSEQMLQFLFRSAKELVINVFKHARAKQVVVRIQPDNNRIKLEIQDDGCGFPEQYLQNSAKTHGYGLLSIRERSQFMGGTFSITSQTNGGTTVCLFVPFVQERNDEHQSIDRR